MHNELEPYQPISTLLAAKRRSKRMSVGKVAKTMRLPEETIEELEDLNMSSMSSSQAAGLLKRYAQVLGVSEKVSDMLENIEPAQRFIVWKPGLFLQPTVVLSRILQVSVVVVILAAVFGYGSWQVRALGAAPGLTLNGEERSILRTPQGSYVVSGESPIESTILINGDPVPLSSEGTFEAKVYLQPGINIIDVSAINNFGRASQQQRIVHWLPENPALD